MFKKILQCSVLVLMAIVVAACHENDHRDRDNGNVNCYHHNGNVNCHRYY